MPEYKADPQVPPIKIPPRPRESWIEPLAGKPLDLRLKSRGVEILLAPVHWILDERFAVYWKVVTE